MNTRIDDKIHYDNFVLSERKIPGNYEIYKIEFL